VGDVLKHFQWEIKELTSQIASWGNEDDENVERGMQ